MDLAAGASSPAFWTWPKGSRGEVRSMYYSAEDFLPGKKTSSAVDVKQKNVISQLDDSIQKPTKIADAIEMAVLGSSHFESTVKNRILDRRLPFGQPNSYFQIPPSYFRFLAFLLAFSLQPKQPIKSQTSLWVVSPGHRYEGSSLHSIPLKRRDCNNNSQILPRPGGDRHTGR